MNHFYNIHQKKDKVARLTNAIFLIITLFLIIIAIYFISIYLLYVETGDSLIFLFWQ